MAGALVEDAGAMQRPNQIAGACIHPSIICPGNNGQDDCPRRGCRQCIGSMCLQTTTTLCTGLTLRMYAYAPGRLHACTAHIHATRHGTLADDTPHNVTIDSRWVGQLQRAGSKAALQSLCGMHECACSLLCLACDHLEHKLQLPWMLPPEAPASPPAF